MYKSNYNYERRRSKSWIWPTIIAINLANVALQVGIGIGEHRADADDRVHDVQAYNSQVQQQLADSYDQIDGLTLTNGDDQTFTFHTKNQVGQDEACHGDHKVHGDKAQAVGKIVCATTTAVNR